MRNDRVRNRHARLLTFLFLWQLGFLFLGSSALYAQDAQSAYDAIHILQIRGVINPPVANYLQRALTDAANQNARLVVVELDTPGGLDTSMREMTQAILASPVPVVVYVTPQGARAASAGLFVLVASNVAAMAPNTNTGAAHPVGLGGGGDQEVDEVMVSKVVNDAAATIRSLASNRDRNAEWAEQAVRESVSITAKEALELNVIDVVADDLDHLLEQIDGWSVETSSGEVMLNVADAPRYDAPMNFAEQLLHVISTPDIAFILLSVGTIGLIAELYNPGTLIPGITGVISLIFAFTALGNLPTNWAGVAFIVLALVLLVAELSTDATGVLGTGATIAFLLGGLMLFRPIRAVPPTLPDLSVNPWLLGGTTVVMAAFIFLVIGQVARTRNSPLQTGQEQYVGKLATVHQELAPQGRVHFDSQLWFAQLRSSQKVPAQQPVRIVGMDGLTLIVEPTDETVVVELEATDNESDAEDEALLRERT
ncbi:nodulation protein NfeD [Chloroflexi bacterium TSY]|nr:nodulation protein NfeD [Chloroflexi bacterium TSY]